MKKILIVQDIPIHSLEMLHKHYELDQVYEYYRNNTLSSWLQYHGYLKELQQLTLLKHTADDSLQKLLLAMILGADFSKANQLNQPLLTDYLTQINEIKQTLGTKFSLSDVTHVRTTMTSTIKNKAEPSSTTDQMYYTPSGSYRSSGSGQLGGYGLHII